MKLFVAQESILCSRGCEAHYWSFPFACVCAWPLSGYRQHGVGQRHTPERPAGTRIFWRVAPKNSSTTKTFTQWPNMIFNLKKIQNSMTSVIHEICTLNKSTPWASKKVPQRFQKWAYFCQKVFKYYISKLRRCRGVNRHAYYAGKGGSPKFGQMCWCNTWTLPNCIF